jgi:prolyl-tRNA editing enzyme YbaK/EbsC (Cys-tRNA(Pro) deacylase)
MAIIKTKITEYLDAKDIQYRVLPHSEPVFTVETAAAQRGVVKEEMVKSILLREKKTGRYVMACVTGEARLNPQAVRKYLEGDWKRLSFASAEEVQKVVGTVMGAVAPLCLPEDVPAVFDEAIAACPKVSISSGDPMAGLELDPEDLIRAADAIQGRITHE